MVLHGLIQNAVTSLDDSPSDLIARHQLHQFLHRPLPNSLPQTYPLPHTTHLFPVATFNSLLSSACKISATKV